MFQSTQQRPGLGFPAMRVVMLMAFATGVLLDKETGETALLRALLGSLRQGDVVVANRYYCSYWMIALLRELGVDVAARLHQLRRCNFNHGPRLGEGMCFKSGPDRIVPPGWTKRLIIKLAKILHRHCRVVHRKATPSTLDCLSACNSEFDEVRTDA